MNSAVPSRVRELARSPELTAFCSLLERYLDTGEGEELLPTRAAALAVEARSLELPPEHILYALRVARCNVGHTRPATEFEREAGRRYAAALALLLRHYFGVHDDDIEPVGDVARAKSPAERDFRAEVAVRMVADARSGELWRVHMVREGYSWEPAVELRQRDWLSCESGAHRRYISPPPPHWLECEESVLLAMIRSAPLDEQRKPDGSD